MALFCKKGARSACISSDSLGECLEVVVFFFIAQFFQKFHADQFAVAIAGVIKYVDFQQYSSIVFNRRTYAHTCDGR